MSRSSADDTDHANRRARERQPPDEISPSHAERLLRDAQNAALLGHRITMMNIEAQHRLAQYRSHFDLNQPRVPAGHPDGGQWTNAGGDSESPTLSDVTPDNDWQPGAQYANSRGRGLGPSGRGSEPEPGQAVRLAIAEARANYALARVREVDPNWRPQPGLSNSLEGRIRDYEATAEQAEARLRELARFELPPIVPRERPDTAKERNDIAREVAQWLVRNRGTAIERSKWLEEAEASIDAYLDPPRTLEELRKGAVSGSKGGYDIHHIVEKTAAEDDGFPKSMTNGPDNLVRVPRYKHWEITSWYMTKNRAFGNVPPREYLRGKGWDARIRVGLMALRRHGVLKP
jgi:hypothetical protein